MIGSDGPNCSSVTIPRLGWVQNEAWKQVVLRGPERPIHIGAELDHLCASGTSLLDETDDDLVMPRHIERAHRRLAREAGADHGVLEHGAHPSTTSSKRLFGT